MNRREFLIRLAVLAGAAAIPTLPQIIDKRPKNVWGKSILSLGQLWYLDNGHWVNAGEARLKLVEDILDTHGKAYLWDKEGEWMFEKFHTGFVPTGPIFEKLPNEELELNIIVEKLDEQRLRTIIGKALCTI